MSSGNETALDCLQVWMAPYGDANPYQSQLIRHLAKLGVNVRTRRTPELLNGIAEEVRNRGDMMSIVHLHWLPSFRANRLALPFFKFAAQIRELKKLGCQFVWTAHDLYHSEVRWKGIDRRLSRMVCKSASAIVAHSPSAARLVEEEYGLPSGTVTDVVSHPSYLDLYKNEVTKEEARKRLNLPDGKKVFLFFGAIREYKGVTELLSAFLKSTDDSCHLLVVGKVYDRSLVEDFHAPALEGRVRLIDQFIEDDDVQVYMNASDVVVFPYKEYLTSGAVLLAMSFGRACIAPGYGFMSDVLDSQGAVLYRHDASNALAEALATASRLDPGRVEGMGTHNLAQAGKWTWAGAAKQTARIYERISGNSVASCQGSRAISVES